MRDETTAFTTSGIWERGDPIVLVYHADDGSWQFLPGTEVGRGEGVCLHLGHILERQPDLAALADLPQGWAAERPTVGDAWDRYALPEGEE